MIKKKPKTKTKIKDYEKIISIQERIIKATESERGQVHDLFLHYLDKSVEGWDWYARYWSEYRRLIKLIKHFDNKASVGDLKKTVSAKGDWLETHDVPDWFKKVGPND